MHFLRQQASQHFTLLGHTLRMLVYNRTSPCSLGSLHGGGLRAETVAMARGELG